MKKKKISQVLRMASRKYRFTFALYLDLFLPLW